MPQATRPKFAQIRSWLNEIHREKSAATKSSKAHSEFGGYAGETTHPSKDVDDGLEKATTGERASENEKDVKKMNFAGHVDETSENPGPKQEDLNYNIGVKQAPTGEAPEVEDDYKDRPDDPGTSHPANADDIGPKYGSWIKKEAAALSNLANEILADIATGVGLTSAPSVTPVVDNTVKAAATQTEAIQIGSTLDTLLGLDKSAADQAAQLVIAETIKQAQLGADRVGPYLLSYMQETEKLIKKAEGGPPMLPPDAAGGGAPVDPAMLAGAGAGGPPPGAEGGLPPEAGAGGPPPGAEGDVPPGAEGGEGGGDHEQALQELAMALMELGITPEELAQLSAGGGAEGGGPAAGGAPPAPGGPAEMGAKIASAVKNYKRSGKFRFTEAKTAAQQTQRAEMKRYITEILGATRG